MRVDGVIDHDEPAFGTQRIDAGSERSESHASGVRR
jgi:hypothetical protein